MQQFIHEYPRNKNRFVTLQILEEYNKVSQDSLSILVYKRTSGVHKGTAYNDSLLRREISLLDNKGNELWATPIGITSLSGAKVNVVKRGSEKFIIVRENNAFFRSAPLKFPPFIIVNPKSAFSNSVFEKSAFLNLLI